MCDFYIYSAGRRVGLLQNVESVQWLECYQTPGEVKITARATPENLALLAPQNRVFNTQSDTAALLLHTEICETDGQSHIVARGVLTAALLGQRAVMATQTVQNPEAAIYSIYQKNCRGLPLQTAAPAALAANAPTEVSWCTVLEAVQTLAQTAGLGFKAVFCPQTGAETLTVYKGKNRTLPGSANYTGYFSTGMGNLHNLSIATGTANYKNVAVVVGPEETTGRPVRTVALFEAEGEDRREMLVEAKDVRREYRTATDTGRTDAKGNPIYTYETKTYTDDEYNALLDAKGYEALAKCPETLAVTCDIEQANLMFGTDYFLGDEMPLKLPEYGFEASARVEAVKRIYDSGGVRLSVTLSGFLLAQ